jgi:tRNA(fMet)-specific endonuclease VapC
MIYLLDTNVCIPYLNGRAPAIRTNLQARKPSEIRVCSVVKAELFAGAQKSTDPIKSLAKQRTFLAPFLSLPFDDAAADFYASIRAHLETRGLPTGSYDMQIAAIALANGCTLITNNVVEFSRVQHLMLEDWEVEPDASNPQPGA